MSILFVTPCYGGMVHAGHMRSCLELKEELTKAGIGHDWLLGTNESLVHRARMELTADFLETGHSHMMWLDADIEFEVEHVNALWNLQADIAVGVYAMKVPGKDMFAAWKDNEPVTDLDRFDGPAEVDVAGTGFMMIKREVIEKLKEKHGTYESQDGRRIPAIYLTPIHDDGLESEDYHFCRIAREAGFSLVMDPAVRPVHWGAYPFGGRTGIVYAA